MKKVIKLTLLKLLLFMPAPLVASPLDLVYDTPGNFWGKVDASPTASPTIEHNQFEIEQGIRFAHMKWLTWYGSFNWWEQTSVSRNNHWAYGVKNTTWFSPFILGIEEQGYVFSGDVVNPHLLVGYISTYAAWGSKTNNE